VIDEAVRLCPPIAALSRVALGPDKLGDQAVKRGSLMVIAPYVLHRHRMLWDAPDVFDPTRFLGEKRHQINRFAYMPFGAGARICIGSAFALQEATIALAMLASRFRFLLEPGAQIWPSLRVTLRPQSGVSMHIEPKTDRHSVH
jgi:cytochrome P450